MQHHLIYVCAARAIKNINITKYAIRKINNYYNKHIVRSYSYNQNVVWFYNSRSLLKHQLIKVGWG